MQSAKWLTSTFFTRKKPQHHLNDEDRMSSLPLSRQTDSDGSREKVNGDCLTTNQMQQSSQFADLAPPVSWARQCRLVKPVHPVYSVVCRRCRGSLPVRWRSCLPGGSSSSPAAWGGFLQLDQRRPSDRPVPPASCLFQVWLWLDPASLRWVW